MDEKPAGMNYREWLDVRLAALTQEDIDVSEPGETIREGPCVTLLGQATSEMIRLHILLGRQGHWEPLMPLDSFEMDSGGVSPMDIMDFYRKQNLWGANTRALGAMLRAEVSYAYPEVQRSEALLWGKGWQLAVRRPHLDDAPQKTRSQLEADLA